MAGRVCASPGGADCQYVALLYHLSCMGLHFLIHKLKRKKKNISDLYYHQYLLFLVKLICFV